MNREQAIIPLQGAMNCRDLGGYATKDGQVVRTGAVFRSDRLSELTEDDRAELATYGIRTIVDFRTKAESSRDPSRLWPGITSHVPLSVGDEIAQQHEFVERLKLGQIKAVSVADISSSYLGMLSEYPEQFATFLDLVADLDNLPLLFHCTAGKDRTGIAAALVLEVCGVHRKTVLDDYEMTNQLRSEKRIAQLRPELEAAGVSIEAIRPALSAPRESLLSLLDYIDINYGSVFEYAVDALHVMPAQLEAIQMNLIT
jgi:protein-tyrosine phosphatase